METIHPLKLEALLEASQPVEILDIRPRAEFEKIHIEGAHSTPSAEISAGKLVCTRELCGLAGKRSGQDDCHLLNLGSAQSILGA